MKEVLGVPPFPPNVVVAVIISVLFGGWVGATMVAATYDVVTAIHAMRKNAMKQDPPSGKHGPNCDCPQCRAAD